MEHKLITGGEQWLPFARSRIKAMRATGLQYASQKYDLSGDVVEVRIAGEHDYITIRGGNPLLYCETGQLEWPFRPLYSPMWGEVASWKFMDIQTTSQYLGRIKTSKNERGDQLNPTGLASGMRSKAIGWPLGDGSDPTDAEIQAKYFNYTITKKKSMVVFPASLFSGKMRLFMQALYGAKEPDPDKGYFPFSLDDVDAPTVLTLRGSQKTGGGTLIARPNSMGIFTAPDDTYWLLDINEGPRNVLVNKINTSKATSLVKQLKDMSADERTKAEAYIFANSEIEIPEVGNTVYATGTFPGVVGSPMAYGWKWSASGAKASIVVHEQLGDTISTTRWHARTVHLTFTYTAKTANAPARISVSGITEDHNDWIDGWGEYNIFVPGNPPVLDLYTLRAGSGLIPPLIPFPTTPIYGWYVGEAWTPLTLKTDGVQYVTVDSDTGGITYPYGGIADPHTLSPEAGGKAEGGASYTTHTVAKNHNPGRVVSFGGASVVGGAVNIDDRVITAVAEGNLGLVGSTSSGFLTTPAGFPTSSADVIIQRGIDAGRAVYRHSIMQTATKTSTQTTGDVYTRFVIVVPHGDCEAFYIPRTVNFDTTTVVTTEQGNTSFRASYFWIDATVTPNVKMFLGEGGNWTDLHYLIVSGDWVDVDGVDHTGFHTTTVNGEPAPAGITDVLCFNRAVQGLVGVPGGSYNGLFDVNYTYPQYDRGMYTYTSYNGRYIMSEAPPSPAAPPATGGYTFVGWA